MPNTKSRSSKTHPFKCTKCDRTFAMAAHLARHQSTMHARGVKAKSAKRGSIGKAVRRISIHSAGGADMQLIGQMQSYRENLIAQRTSLNDRIDAIERAMSTLGAPARQAPKRGGASIGRRGRGGPSLKMCVERVLDRNGKPMSVKDITAGVRRVGYRTTNRTLDKSVGLALAAMPNVIRVTRGVFKIK